MSTHPVLPPALRALPEALSNRKLRALPLALQKAGCALLHPQCWLWGHDVRRMEGNLLLAYGFQRVRPPRAVNGCSQYTLPLEDGLQLRLWGFGMFLGRAVAEDAAWEGLFVNRYSFTPWRVVLGGDVWENRVFKHMPRSTDWPLLSRAIRAVLEYEHFLAETAGVDYRKQCLYGWEDQTLSMERLSAGWKDLLTRVERLPTAA